MKHHMYISSREMLAKEPFALLVSGGVDSIAAAHWLKHRCRLNYSVVHCNHGVQPEVNEQMQRSVRSFCSNYNIDLHTIKSSRYVDHTEAACRQFRIESLTRLRAFTGIRLFVTAHHLDDAVESYMMNTLKGIPERVPIPVTSSFSTDDFRIHHPFLSIPKEAFVEYAREYGLHDWIVQDPTNKSNKHTRNWVRNEVLPPIYDRGVHLREIVKKKFYAVH